VLRDKTALDLRVKLN